jgi:hypothetical protein
MLPRSLVHLKQKIACVMIIRKFRENSAEMLRLNNLYHEPFVAIIRPSLGFYVLARKFNKNTGLLY